MDVAPPSPYEAVAAPAALPPASARLLAWLERIAADLQVAEGSGEAPEAREAFLRATGRVHDGDASFDERMALFLEWFLLDRVRRAAPRVPPVQMWFAQHGDGLDPAERPWVVGLAASHRSVLRWVGPAGGQGITVDDLLHGFRWRVADPAPPGLGLGDVFHARLVGVGGQVHCTGTFCYHPPEVAQRIARHLEAVAPTCGAGDAEIDRLLRLRLDYDRSPETPARTIYRLEARSRP